MFSIWNSEVQRDRRANVSGHVPAILESVSKTKKIVVAEEHQRLGGLASTIALLLAEEMPTPMTIVAVQDSFGESATPAELMKKYGLDADSIYEACKSLLND